MKESAGHPRVGVEQGRLPVGNLSPTHHAYSSPERAVDAEVRAASPVAGDIPRAHLDRNREVPGSWLESTRLNRVHKERRTTKRYASRLLPEQYGARPNRRQACAPGDEHSSVLRHARRSHPCRRRRLATTSQRCRDSSVALVSSVLGRTVARPSKAQARRMVARCPYARTTIP